MKTVDDHSTSSGTVSIGAGAAGAGTSIEPVEAGTSKPVSEEKSELYTCPLLH